MKKLFILTAVLLSLSTNAFSQFNLGPYEGKVSIGGGIGVGENGESLFSLETLHGIRMNPYIFVGLGIGLHTYDTSKGCVIPIFLNATGYFMDKKLSPYAALSAGYGIGAGEDLGGIGGLYLAPEVGLKIGILGDKAIEAGIQYQSQTMAKQGNSVNLGAVSIRAGFVF